MFEPILRQNVLRYQEEWGRVNLESYLEALLAGLSQGVLFILLDGTIANLNESAATCLGVERSVCRGSNFWSLFPDDCFGFSLKEALRFALAQKLIYKRIGARDFEISSSFFFEGSKNTHGLLLFLRDTTQTQKQSEQLLQGERMRELGEMSARVAHEIRNALGPIRGYASLLYRDLAEERHLQEMAGIVIEGVKSLESLVSRILHYSRPLKIETRSVEMGLFLKKLGRFVRADPAFPEAVRLEIHIPQEPLLAPIDPDALQSCLLNLIYNGFQAMEKGGVLLISLLKPLEHFCQIDISDSGVGIGEEHLSQLFSPFFTTKKQGTGLGLAESQKIAKAHGGAIEVRSQSGRGTTFTLTLPLKR